MSAPCSETLMATKAMTTLLLARLPTRKRRRRAILPPCSLLQVLEVLQRVPLSVTSLVRFPSSIPIFTCRRKTDTRQPMIVATTRASTMPPQPHQPRRRLQQLLPLIHTAMALLRMPLLPQTPTQMPQPSKSPHQFLPTTRMALLFQVVIASPWRRSARSLLRPKRSTKKSLKRLTTTKTWVCGFLHL